MITNKEISEYKENHILLRENNRKGIELEKNIRNFEKNLMKKLKPLCNNLLPFSDSYYQFEFSTHAVIIRFYNSFSKSITITVFYENLHKIKTHDDLLKFVFRG